MSDTPLYQDRLSAGEALAEDILASLPEGEIAVRVYALPRGGIPVAFPVAQKLQCPLEVLAAKKITLPPKSELALGAVTPDGTTIWAHFSQVKGHNQQELEDAKEQAQSSAIAQQEQFSPHCPSAPVENTIVILIDDGIATGMTMLTAVEALRKQNPAQIWVATPVAPREMQQQFQNVCDQVIIRHTPEPFLSVGRFYAKFPQTSTEQAISYLESLHQQS